MCADKETGYYRSVNNYYQYILEAQTISIYMFACTKMKKSIFITRKKKRFVIGFYQKYNKARLMVIYKRKKKKSD